MTCSGANVDTVIFYTLGLGEQQRSATDFDRERDALRRRHGPVAVDRLGVVPCLAALGRQVGRGVGHTTDDFSGWGRLPGMRLAAVEGVPAPDSVVSDLR